MWIVVHMDGPLEQDFDVVVAELNEGETWTDYPSGPDYISVALFEDYKNARVYQRSILNGT